MWTKSITIWYVLLIQLWKRQLLETAGGEDLLVVLLYLWKIHLTVLDLSTERYIIVKCVKILFWLMFIFNEKLLNV